MSIKNQIEIFKTWQQNVIGYDRYIIQYRRNKYPDLAIDVYTKAGGYIKLRKIVNSENKLLTEIIKIIELYEGPESANQYREQAQKNQ